MKQEREATPRVGGVPGIPSAVDVDAKELFKIFIGGLPQEATKDDLQHAFAKFGNLIDAVVMVDRATSRSRGFGFISFDNGASVDDALTEKNHVVCGKEVECKRAAPREAIPSHGGGGYGGGHSDRGRGGSLMGGPSKFKTDKLFVGGIPDITTEEFQKYFEQFGRVTDAVLMVDRETNRPRGFGFITFQNCEAVDIVMRKYDNHYLKGKWVECKLAMPRDSPPGGGGKEGHYSSGPPGRNGGGYMDNNIQSMRSNPPYNTYMSGYGQMSRDYMSHGGMYGTPEYYGPQGPMGYPPHGSDLMAHGGYGDHSYYSNYHDMMGMPNRGTAGYGHTPGHQTVSDMPGYYPAPAHGGAPSMRGSHKPSYYGSQYPQRGSGMDTSQQNGRMAYDEYYMGGGAGMGVIPNMDTNYGPVMRGGSSGLSNSLPASKMDISEHVGGVSIRPKYQASRAPPLGAPRAAPY